MITVEYAPQQGGSHSFFATNGFTADEANGPGQYARRLAQYISDPSTVRVRTIEMYGVAPSIEDIRHLRELWLRETQVKIEKSYRYGITKAEKREAERLAKIEEDAAKGIVAKPRPAPPPPKPAPNWRRPITSSTEVIANTAGYFGITGLDITSKRKESAVVRPRKLAAAVLFARGAGYSQIGGWLGDRDHSTIRHSVITFFDREICRPDMRAGWDQFAPCVLKAARTVDEVLAMTGRGA